MARGRCDSTIRITPLREPAGSRTPSPKEQAQMRLTRTRSTALATVLAVAIGGAATATAADLITGADIKDNSVKGLDIKNGSVKKKDLGKQVRDALDAKAAPGAEGPAGPQGPAGPAGPQGPAGAGVVRFVAEQLQPIDEADTTIVALELPAGQWLLQAKTELDNAADPQEGECELWVGDSELDESNATLADGKGNTVTLMSPVALDAPAEAVLRCTTDNSANDPTVARFAKITALQVSSIVD
jgi:hypothetical protein